MTARVLVVDDHELVRAGLATLLAVDEGIEVVGTAEDGPTAVTMALALHPDVVLMDVEMPGGDGLTATARIRQQAPAVQVLVLTMFDVDDYVLEALRAGASGFLVKTTGPRELAEAVKASAAGRTVLGPTVLRRLVDSYVSAPPPRAPVAGLETLTARERDVLRAMARGLSNAEIAAEMYLAETTVKTHVAHILAKLGVRDRVRAVVLAHESGLARGP